MTKKKVFISYDFDNDRNYKALLNAWCANKNIDFEFEDGSSGKINSTNVAVVKAALTRRINEADYTLVIIGKEANKRHKDSDLIGYKNWINFEIARSKVNGNKLIAVKLKNYYESPEEMLGAKATWAMCFTYDSIISALNRV